MSRPFAIELRSIGEVIQPAFHQWRHKHRITLPFLLPGADYDRNIDAQRQGETIAVSKRGGPPLRSRDWTARERKVELDTDARLTILEPASTQVPVGPA